MIERAIEIAVEAHKGQRDKAGRPYILHVLRVVAAMKTDEECAVAALHDVLEDCADWSFLRLKDEGMSMAVIDAVDALTKRKGEAYDDYLRRVERCHLARKVKIADLRDNADLTRLSAPTARDQERAIKYQNALIRLAA